MDLHCVRQRARSHGKVFNHATKRCLVQGCRTHVPHTMRHQQRDTIFMELPCVQAQSHATKRYFAVARPQATRVGRTGPVVHFVGRAALLQPITAQTTLSAGQQSGGSRREFFHSRNGDDESNYTSTEKSSRTPASCYVRDVCSGSEKRAGITSVRLWVMVHFHRRMAGALSTV